MGVDVGGGEDVDGLAGYTKQQWDWLLTLGDVRSTYESLVSRRDVARSSGQDTRLLDRFIDRTRLLLDESEQEARRLNLSEEYARACQEIAGSRLD